MRTLYRVTSSCSSIGVSSAIYLSSLKLEINEKICFRTFVEVRQPNSLTLLLQAGSFRFCMTTFSIRVHQQTAVRNAETVHTVLGHLYRRQIRNTTCTCGADLKRR